MKVLDEAVGLISP